MYYKTPLPKFFIFRLIIFNFFLFLLSYTALAEGTKQLAPDSLDRIYLYTNGGTYNNFGRYNGEDDQRLYIHISDPEKEQVYLGFSRPVTSGHYPCSASIHLNGFFRIKDPTGRVVYPTKDDDNGQILNATTSNITSYQQAVAGPKPIGDTSGYTPFIFDPTGLSSGDYYVEFSRIINQVSLDNPLPIEWFDITVATKDSTPTAIDGRVFSRNWALFAPSPSCGMDSTYTWFDRSFNGKFFVYTDQKLVTEVDFKGAGFQPAAFNVVFNDVGTTRTNDVIKDRKSIENARSSASQHRIFLNDPDINVYPTGKLGQFSITPQLYACDNGTACVQAEVTEPGQIDVLINLDTATGANIYDIGSADVIIAFQINPEPGEQPPYQRCIPWDGKNAFGERIGDRAAIEKVDFLIRYTQGIYHFPIYDAEFMLKGFDVTTIRPIPNNGSPKRVYYDDLNIPDAYGTGITASKENPFNGCNIPCHKWTAQPFGDLNTINTWFFAREEITLQLDLGGCPMVGEDDSVTIRVNMDTAINVLMNDFGTEKIDTTSITVGITAPNGMVQFDTVSLNAQYMPDSGYIGRDSFSYVFCYGILPVRSLCDSSWVYIDILADKENCMNMVDDDGDGKADCDDPDCQPIMGSIQRKKQNDFWLLCMIILFLSSLAFSTNMGEKRDIPI
jgi:hypothetical protein